MGGEQFAAHFFASGRCMNRMIFTIVAITACSDAPAPAPAPAPTTPAPSPAHAHAHAPAPTGFDPFTVRVGDTIAGLTLSRIDVQMALDSLPSGDATFVGEVELDGEYRPHFDFPEVRTACYWVDSTSWNRLPRMNGDTRRQNWFCFRNQEKAIRELGELGTRKVAKIVVDSFTTHVARSDVWNAATFVRVIK